MPTMKLFHFLGACSRVTAKPLIKLGIDYDSQIIDVYLNWCLSTAASVRIKFATYSKVVIHFEKAMSIPEYQEALSREQALIEQ